MSDEQETYEGEVVVEPAEETALARRDAGPMPITAEQLAAEIEATAEHSRRMRQLAASLTRDDDWVRMGDKVYLQSIGAERILAAAGLVRRVLERPKREDRKDDNGSYYIYRCMVALEDRHGRTLIELHLPLHGGARRPARQDADRAGGAGEQPGQVLLDIHPRRRST